MASEIEIRQSFAQLYARFANKGVTERRPLLAHYTSVQIMADIIKNEEVWFSNPLFMNDLEEMRFGVNQGEHIFYNSKEVDEAAGSPERLRQIGNTFAAYMKALDDTDALNIYVFCLSEHNADNSNGLLSMWRGYGGHGNGAALVFDTSKLTFVESSPLLVVPVTYATREKRIEELTAIVRDWAQIVRSSDIPDDKLYIAVHALFSLIKLFALINKHDGFHEEREWRVFYMPEHDPNGLLKEFIHVEFGPRGIEPRLKYKVRPREGVTAANLSLLRLIDRIILGPHVASPLAVKSTQMLFERLGKPEVAAKVVASNIPLRPSTK